MVAPSQVLKFSCHPGISCFTACCADLHLVLTPYDILRMKKRLGLASGEFLERYTEPHDGRESALPLVRLRMTEGEGRPCPFVSPKGCTIYEDRPGACRLYPLGRAASGLPGREEGSFYFVVNESHCLGFGEDREWTVEEWVRDQGAGLYNEMNRPWMEVVTGRVLGELTEKRLAMFHMVSYNLDRFREFVFRTTFLDAFDVSPEEVRGASTDDAKLLRLGMSWLRFALLGEPALALRTEASPTYAGRGEAPGALK